MQFVFKMHRYSMHTLMPFLYYHTIKARKWRGRNDKFKSFPLQTLSHTYGTLTDLGIVTVESLL